MDTQSQIEENKLNYVELPFLASNSADAILSSEYGTKALQKKRRYIRELLALPDQKSIPIGRGTVTLDVAFVLPCMLTATRWSSNSPHLETFCDAIKSNTQGLFLSVNFDRVSDLITDKIQSSLSTKGTADTKRVSADVNKVISNLVWEEKQVRGFAKEYSRIFSSIVNSLPTLKRLQGKVVRFEKEGALVAIDLGNIEDYRMVSEKQLEDVGIVHVGQAFMLLEQEWTPGVTVSHYQPAIPEESPYLDETLERALRDAETELPDVDYEPTIPLTMIADDHNQEMES